MDCGKTRVVLSSGEGMDARHYNILAIQRGAFYMYSATLKRGKKSFELHAKLPKNLTAVLKTC